MRSANSQLSGQLARARQEAERETGLLRSELGALAGRFKAEQERLAGLRERLAEECRGRSELEAAHQERLHDLHKRLQAEHLLRYAVGGGCRWWLVRGRLRLRLG
jgi:chromosome segregation ATPase